MGELMGLSYCDSWYPKITAFLIVALPYGSLFHEIVRLLGGKISLNPMASSDLLEIVDDRDPRVQPLPLDSWVLSGVTEEYKSTTSGTITGGSRVRFTFTGHSVAVYGTISKNMSRPKPISTYSIDDSAPETFNVAKVPEEALYRQLFYQSPTLEDKEHVLVVTSMVSESEFWLDYFQLLHTIPPLPSTNTFVSSITSSGPPITSPGQSSTMPIIQPQSSSLMPTINTSMSSIITSRQSSITPTIHLQPSTTQDGGPLSSTSSNTEGARINKGLIAGATIGGVVVVVLAAIIIWATFGRKTRRSSSIDANSTQPFIYPNRDWTPSLSALERNPSGYLAPERQLHYTTGSTEKPSHGPERALGGLGPEHTNEPAIQVIRHHSANLIPHTMDSEFIGPPPEYDNGP